MIKETLKSKYKIIGLFYLLIVLNDLINSLSPFLLIQIKLLFYQTLCADNHTFPHIQIPKNKAKSQQSAFSHSAKIIEMNENVVKDRNSTKIRNFDNFILLRYEQNVSINPT